MRRSVLVVWLSALALLAAVMLPASAAAKNRVLAPPGNSGVNQYDESVPTAAGNQPTNTLHPGTRVPGGPGGGGGRGSAISPSTQRALDRQGAAGRAAAALALATAPGAAHRRPSGQTNGAGRAAGSAAPAGAGFSPVKSLIKAFTGSASGGLGPLLPILLVVSALGAMALAIIRRRRAT